MVMHDFRLHVRFQIVPHFFQLIPAKLIVFDLFVRRLLWVSNEEQTFSIYFKVFFFSMEMQLSHGRY